MKISRSIIGFCCVLLLSACGGGGGGGGGGDPGPIAQAPQSFPLRGAFSALFANGERKNFIVSGTLGSDTCSGSATFTQAAAVGGASFNNVPGQLSAKRTITMSLIGCTPPLPSQSTNYYDTNYTPLGYDTNPGVNYGVFLNPLGMPESVVVGDTGDLGTLTNYINKVEVSQTKNSYLIERETASSAIVTVIVRDFAPNKDLATATELDRYRIGATGTATLISVSVQKTGLQLDFK